MDHIFTYVLLALVLGFFAWLTIYSFYLLIFSKSDKATGRDESKRDGRQMDGSVRGKFVGRT